MDPVRQFRRQNIVNATLAFNPRQTCELRRDDPDREMCLARAAVRTRGAGMTGMTTAIVLNDKQTGREGSGQFVPHHVGDRHEKSKRQRHGKVKQ